VCGTNKACTAFINRTGFTFLVNKRFNNRVFDALCVGLCALGKAREIESTLLYSVVSTDYSVVCAVCRRSCTVRCMHDAQRGN
jgi:hypothetical protein